MTMLRFELRIIGGPYDGTSDLGFATPESGPDSKPLPEAIWLGVCPGDQGCHMRRCRSGRRHVAYWVPELDEDPPVGSIEYELEEDSVVEAGWHGSARYVLGGLGSRGDDEIAAYAGSHAGAVA